MEVFWYIIAAAGAGKGRKAGRKGRDHLTLFRPDHRFRNRICGHGRREIPGGDRCDACGFVHGRTASAVFPLRDGIRADSRRGFCGSRMRRRDRNILTRRMGHRHCSRCRTCGASAFFVSRFRRLIYEGGGRLCRSSAQNGLRKKCTNGELREWKKETAED